MIRRPDHVAILVRSTDGAIPYSPDTSCPRSDPWHSVIRKPA
jgi:hypothetical protein